MSAERDGLPEEEYDTLWLAYLAGWASTRVWTRVPTPQEVSAALREELACDAYKWIYRH